MFHWGSALPERLKTLVYTNEGSFTGRQYALMLNAIMTSEI